MTMKSFLSQSNYQLNDESGIWMRPNYRGISYNDGDNIEKKILSVLKRTQNLDVMSSDLYQECVDWPSTYHFSRKRSNLLRPFSDLLSKHILEVGAGCGAITRYLGECGGNVVAVEGSPRRAAIARERTRDLNNVDVVCDKLQNFNCSQNFDVVTLIGVLEYASLFTESEHPALEMLQKTRSFLNSSGKLILAIENQLGLKYFAGFNEDHVGMPMFGIEGRYGSGAVRTYGRLTLKNLLEEAGYHNIQFYAPFPDYKLPNVVISEDAFLNKNFGAATLIAQATPSDPQSPKSFSFSQELAWDVVISNGIGMDFANSFIVLADKESPQIQLKERTTDLAWYFNTDRRARYCKSVKFKEDNHNISAKSSYLYTDKNSQPENDILTHEIHSNDKYLNGKTLADKFFLSRQSPTINEEEIINYFACYYKILRELVDPDQSIRSWNAQTTIDGVFFDCIPQNIICHKGSHKYIDREWKLKFQLTIGYLLFRALLIFFDRVSLHTGCILLKDADRSRKSFIIKIFKNVLGTNLREEDISEFSKLEASVQNLILDRQVDYEQFEDLLLHDIGIARIYTSDALTNAKTEAEQAKVEAEQAKVEAEQVRLELIKLKQSKFWVLTMPARKIFDLLKTISKK